MNSVTLIGRMTQDPELKYTPSGHALASFTIAVDRKFKSADGQKQTDFLKCTAWRQPAEFAAKYLGKGRLVAVQGSIQTGSWEQDGQKRYKTEIVVDSIQGLDKGKNPETPQPEEEVQEDEFNPFA